MKLTRHMSMRLLSVTLIAACLAVGLMKWTECSVALVLCFSLLSGCAVLLEYPTSGCNPSEALNVCLVTALLALSFACAGLCWKVIIGTEQAVTLAFVVFSVSGRYSGKQPVMGKLTAWSAVEEYSRLIYLALWCFLCGLLATMEESCFLWFMVPASAVLYAVLYIRAYYRVSMLVSPKQDARLRRMSPAGIRTVWKPPPEEMTRMTVIFARVQSVMEKDRPFLEDCTLESLSRDVYCNKAYLSRTINTLTGMTFCKFINSYRVPYALELMKKDPRLKMKELALMSGFQNIVTFNVSFKEVTGDTPTGYAEKLRMGLH